ncbi:Type II secretion system protein E [Pseudobythopirellula maris]|uniref:Type II secretion system protein E n=1 Tax=Pseudobythopirellula maris TaxID=2527991 RepID=A0A5C5ZTI8_9BACT|nr:GspE/PulE family protein [Pseudobythopirellula maris]TWT90151.1 Type II secretion system protein E [Pseudobythopirellula maris]
METGEILLKHGLITRDQLDELRLDAATAARPDLAAVERGFAEEEGVLRALGAETGVEMVDLDHTEVNAELLAAFPHRMIHRHALFPVERRNGTMVVATCDPFDVYPLDELSAELGLAIEPVLAPRRKIAERIKATLGVGSETVGGLVALKQAEDGVELLEEIDADGAELADGAHEASVVRLVNEILLEAIETRASDVHIESQAAGIRIRYRIDGMLVGQPTPPEMNHFRAAIVSRLKIMAHLNIAEKRLPQDGRIKLRVHGREVDVRMSVIPMLHGEGIVMRLLDKGRMNFSLQALGMGDRSYEKFSELIRAPHGIVLVTGPTGSGKTTTLYSALTEIRSETTKIITAEDPVEYQLPGINQIQVHSKIGLTFAASLRSILRHDPDVVLVGEIRDHETAENAIQASLTGHMVFSTLHTNDAPSAYTRLVDMGIEPFLVASTIEAVMAQRLVRRLCQDCRQPYEPKQEDLPADFPWDDYKAGGGLLYQPMGCRKCREIGFAGRQGIFELCATTDAVRQLAHDRASSWEIRTAALKDGMRTLRQDAWEKVLLGITTVDEVLRVTKGDRI